VNIIAGVFSTMRKIFPSRAFTRCFFLLFAFLELTLFAVADSNYESLRNRADDLLRKLDQHDALMSRLLMENEFSETETVPSKPVLPSPKSSSESQKFPYPKPLSDDVSTSPKEKVPDDRPSGNLPWLDEPSLPLRAEGYYLGFSCASVLPHSGGVRWPASSSEKDLDFDAGLMVALALGKDFGSVRVELEHAFLQYDEASGKGDAGVSPTIFRVILENELSNRLDMRLGLGAGIDLARIKYMGDGFSGVSFCYDFLAGLGFRLNERMGLNFDYRFFLTAATDDYQRLQNHLFSAQLQFDL